MELSLQQLVDRLLEEHDVPSPLLPERAYEPRFVRRRGKVYYEDGTKTSRLFGGFDVTGDVRETPRGWKWIVNRPHPFELIRPNMHGDGI